MNDSVASVYNLRCKLCNDLEGSRKGTKILSCEGTCGDNFHIKCVNLPDYAADLFVNSAKNVYFKCDSCRNKPSSLPDVFRILVEQKEVIISLTEKIDSLSSQVNKLESKVDLTNENFYDDDDSDLDTFIDDEEVNDILKDSESNLVTEYWKGATSNQQETAQTSDPQGQTSSNSVPEVIVTQPEKKKHKPVAQPKSRESAQQSRPPVNNTRRFPHKPNNQRGRSSNQKPTNNRRYSRNSNNRHSNNSNRGTGRRDNRHFSNSHTQSSQNGNQAHQPWALNSGMYSSNMNHAFPQFINSPQNFSNLQNFPVQRQFSPHFNMGLMPYHYLHY